MLLTKGAAAICNFSEFKKKRLAQEFSNFLKALPDSAFKPKDDDVAASVRRKKRISVPIFSDNVRRIANFRRNKKGKLGFVISTGQASERG